MATILAKFAKPEYLFRPRQLLQRVRMQLRPPATAQVGLRLPWEHVIDVSVNDVIGRAVLHLGVYDLPVTETLWRLTDAGATAVDAGANIGHMTSVLAARVGPTGKVHAFEPHPAIYEALRANIERWNAQLGSATITAHPIALSSRDGEVALYIPDGFEGNAGLATLSPSAHSPARGTEHQVKARRLAEFAEFGRVDVMKLDVEGHELDLLQGAAPLLQSGWPRDIVFEEHQPYPNPVSRLLEGYGYRIWRIERSLRRVLLGDPGGVKTGRTWEAISYLASRDPSRALSRMSAPGWQSLGRITAPASYD